VTGVVALPLCVPLDTADIDDMITVAKETQMTKKEMQGFPLRLSSEEHTALRTFAQITGASANDVVRRALREFLAGPGRREEFETLLKQAREDYALALDKLADL
jgi:hypothetical protein